MPPFSDRGLLRLHDRVRAHVDAGRAPGVLTLLARGDDVRVDAVGAVARDTIFRVSSMTKPVTAAATMLLVEDCVLRLDDPVQKWLPELANRRVLRAPESQLDDTVPAKRAITVRDLLTFRLGFGMIGGLNDKTPIRAAVDARKLYCLGAPLPATPLAPDAWMASFAELPLMHQPGERWLYHTGAMLLAVLVARAAGVPFEVFLRERVFEPLGMRDTGFYVPAEKLGRFVASEWGDGKVFDPVDGHWSRPPVFPDGGAGLVSTVDDWLAFARAMLGQHPQGWLSRASIELMTSDQLTSEQKKVSGFFPGFFDACGWGFGMCVATRRDQVWSVPGRFGWDGGLGTSWWSDPSMGLTGILMTQRAGFPHASPIWQDFWTCAYTSLSG